MSGSAPAAPSTSEVTSRRRVLAWLGAGGAAMLATLFSRDEARAGHDGTNVMHLGVGNNAGNAGTGLDADVDTFALGVFNQNPGPRAGGLVAESRGGALPGVQGVAWDAGFAGVFGVSSRSEPGGFGQGPHNGVQGESGTGSGINGTSESGAGVRGHSESGVGGLFSSTSGAGLQVNGPANISATVAAVDGDTLFVSNDHSDGGGISAVAHNGHGVEGVTLGPEGFGVRGVSGEGDEYGEGPATGVHGQSGTGVGVLGVATRPGGVGVEARSHVEDLTLDAFGLAVRGKAAFSTAGSAVIPARADSIFVENPAVTDESHISVTLTGDPGPRQLAWVERSPGSGFTVHLTPAPPPSKPETSLTYLIVEPA